MSLLESEHKQRKDADRKMQIQSMLADIYNNQTSLRPNTLEFVGSLRGWFMNRGWLTDKQFEALVDVHDRSIHGSDLLCGYDDDE